ncbi:hypothetical protein GCM10011515_20070 [Tsuneonella deserti]|uniref:Uncharacterized protein n=1 Tax=Tsuneonella deserti TaxID=2035528 RepID=A0ABQ1S9C1_9SPHN|nr:hypothetical protein [Tsuneonella deserti]GGE00249.1 hypothetical protein GCM10011515_20070 [Tsuneonella deserti]
MAMMGDILGAARRSAAGFQAWIERTDPALAQRVAAAAAQTGLSFAGYIRAAVADFGRFASEEDWATLMSSLRDSDDPGTLCLLAMVDWRLTAEGCGAHTHGTAGHHHHHHHHGAPDERSAAP